MRAVIQRVASASVDIGGSRRAQIGRGLLVLLGVGEDDDLDDVSWLSGKTARLRIFPDDGGAMNRALSDIGGEALVVSQFTLFASTVKGNRPSFLAAAKPERAVPLYEAFVASLARELGKGVATGEFGADMQVALVNAGPVTVIIDSKNRE
jgi:D-aminoacyl-tRNA deacylase